MYARSDAKAAIAVQRRNVRRIHSGPIHFSSLGLVYSFDGNRLDVLSLLVGSCPS